MLLLRVNLKGTLWLVVVGLGCFAGVAPVLGQLLHANGVRPSFAVASIRPSSPDAMPHGGSGVGRYDEAATTVGEMIKYAYGIGYDGELSGGPRWMSTDKFAVEAKADDAEVEAQNKMSRGDRDEQMRLMMQSLLAERFGLVVRFEMKELPVYELVVAKGGLKCVVDTTSPPALADPSPPRFRWSNAPAPPQPPPGWVPPSAEEMRKLTQSMHLRTKGWPFWLVVTVLSHQPELDGRTVMDKTGLDGSYDCEMTWSQVGSDGPGPSLFTAVQNDLGLKLEPGKGMVEVLVVDGLERPSEN
jgi:bla regulator protein BlaR1